MNESPFSFYDLPLEDLIKKIIQIDNDRFLFRVIIVEDGNKKYLSKNSYQLTEIYRQAVHDEISRRYWNEREQGNIPSPELERSFHLINQNDPFLNVFTG